MTKDSENGETGQNRTSADCILRVEKDRNFTILGLWAVAQDDRLSYKAKGIHTYLMSRPPDWTFNLRDLQNRAFDGRDSVQSGLRELEDAGYLRRERERRDDGTLGRTVWTVSEIPKRSWASNDKGIPQKREIHLWFSKSGKSSSGESASNKNETAVSSDDVVPGIEELRDWFPNSDKKRPPRLAEDEHRCPGCDWHAIHNLKKLGEGGPGLCSDCVLQGKQPEPEQQQRESEGDDSSDPPPELCRTEGCKNARAATGDSDLCRDCRRQQPHKRGLRAI